MEKKDIIRKLREQTKETQSKLAEDLQLSREAYANYETGRRDMPYYALSSMSRYYHVSTDYLLCESALPYSFRELSGDRLYAAEKIFSLNDREIAKLVEYLHRLPASGSEEK